MARTQNPSIPLILLHLLLAAVTGGLWLVVLIIWYVLKK